MPPVLVDACRCQGLFAGLEGWGARQNRKIRFRFPQSGRGRPTPSPKMWGQPLKGPNRTGPEASSVASLCFHRHALCKHGPSPAPSTTNQLRPSLAACSQRFLPPRQLLPLVNIWCRFSPARLSRRLASQLPWPAFALKPHLFGNLGAESLKHLSTAAFTLLFCCFSGTSLCPVKPQNSAGRDAVFPRRRAFASVAWSTCLS